jgi:hypothetical protein
LKIFVGFLSTATVEQLEVRLGTLSAPLSTLGEITTNFTFRALPFLGVITVTSKPSGDIYTIPSVE